MGILNNKTQKDGQSDRKHTTRWAFNESRQFDGHSQQMLWQREKWFAKRWRRANSVVRTRFTSRSPISPKSSPKKVSGSMSSARGFRSHFTSDARSHVCQVMGPSPLFAFWGAAARSEGDDQIQIH
jgi:hypothetical protein